MLEGRKTIIVSPRREKNPKIIVALLCQPAVGAHLRVRLVPFHSEPMNPLALIDAYYPQDNEQKRILLTHSRSVAQKALQLAARHPELRLDLAFVEEAAMLHDVGIFLTDAPTIGCTGVYPYICHGYLGADLLREAGYPRHALVCERHTGAGLSLREIVGRNLPVPHREMIPVSLEEQLICFADKFFSKSKLDREKTVEKARRSIERHGDESLTRFDEWCKLFL